MTLNAVDAEFYDQCLTVCLFKIEKFRLYSTNSAVLLKKVMLFVLFQVCLPPYNDITQLHVQDQ